MDTLVRIGLLALCLLLGMGVLDERNTLEMRATALITLVMLVTIGVAHLLTVKHQRFVKEILADMQAIKEHVIEYEKKRREQP